jgi:ATP synthase protein I
MKRHKPILLFLILALGMSAILGWFFSIHTALSFFLGGGISWIPTTVFAKIFFKNKGTKSARKILNTFYMAEIFKITLTIILFICAFQWKDMQAVALFFGFIIAQLGYVWTYEKGFFS